MHLVPDRYLRALCVTLVGLIWWLDHVTPEYFVPASLYTVPASLSAFGRSARFTVGIVVAALSLNLLEGYLEGQGRNFNLEVDLGRGAAGLAVVIVGFLSVRLQGAGQVKALNASLQEQVAARKRTEMTLQRAQEFARVNRIMMMGEMTASIAHEVNQPLTGIVSNAGTSLRYLTASEPQLDAAREHLELVVRDGRRAADIVTRVRNLAQRAPLTKSPVDLNETIAEVLTLAQEELNRRSTRVSLELADDLPPIPGIRVRLQQVMLNLILNAVEAMHDLEDREPAIVVATGLDGVDFEFVEVRDCGPGLTPEAALRLFEPFYTTKAEGMGMGLAISRLIVEGHGGELRVFTNVPQGAVFRMTLPIKDLDSESG